MSDNTPRLGLPQIVAGQAQMSVTHNEALARLDALCDLCLKGKFINTPPGSPADGDTYLLGAAPSGAWSGYAYKIAYCLDGAWRFFTPFDGMRAFLATTGALILYNAGVWSDFAPPLSAAEVSVASAATCDIGAAASLCVAITGTTTITGFGTGPNALRMVRFAGALTLTHNATSLILKSGATRTTAAGDTGAYVSDGSGNWREIWFQRASKAAAAADICAAGPTGMTLSSSGIGTSGSNAFPFLVNGAEAGRFGSDGSFLVGTTANGGVRGDMRAEFRTANQHNLSVYTTSTAGHSAMICRVDNTASPFASFSYAGSGVGSITTNGSATAFNTSSDERLKDVLAAQRDFRAIIQALWVGDAAFKSAPGDAVLSVLAQQVAPLFPDAVTYPAGDDDSAMWSAEYGRLGILALWGVKDAYAQIAALEARIAALES